MFIHEYMNYLETLPFIKAVFPIFNKYVLCMFNSTKNLLFVILINMY